MANTVSELFTLCGEAKTAKALELWNEAASPWAMVDFQVTVCIPTIEMVRYYQFPGEELDVCFDRLAAVAFESVTNVVNIPATDMGLSVSAVRKRMCGSPYFMTHLKWEVYDFPLLPVIINLDDYGDPSKWPPYPDAE